MTKEKEDRAFLDTPKTETETKVTGYKAAYEEAKEDKRVKSITAEYFEFDKPGKGFVGKLLNKNEVAGKLGGRSYLQYLFHTDDGLIKCALGSAADGEAGAMMEQGKLYHVEFQGKEDIGGGRRVNRFTIERIITEEERRVGGEDDIPF